jgi:hypothetical protein
MKLLASILFSIALASCASISPPAASGTVDHVVMLWLKRPGNSEDRAAVRKAANELRSIPGIIFLDHGTPLASERPVVDDSFDVGFVMRFESAATLGAYESNPLHVKQVTEVLKPLSRKILVYDITR